MDKAKGRRGAGCVAEVSHARNIVRDGTSAHRQRAAWRKAGGGEGGDPRQAARHVVRTLMQETLRGVPKPPEIPPKVMSDAARRPGR